jgi:hypothetical protein
MTVELEKVRIRRVIGPTPSGAAVLLGNDKKTFVVFVGFYEAAALIREINNEVPARPLTHELLQNVFLGFDLEVKQVIISSIIDNTYCATLILEQKVPAKGKEEFGARKNQVRIDARPSDCLILALKNKVDIFVTRDVFDQVQDVAKMTGEAGSGAELNLEALEFEFSPGGKAGAASESEEESEAESGFEASLEFDPAAGEISDESAFEEEEEEEDQSEANGSEDADDEDEGDADESDEDESEDAGGGGGSPKDSGTEGPGKGPRPHRSGR